MEMRTNEVNAIVCSRRRQGDCAPSFGQEARFHGMNAFRLGVGEIGLLGGVFCQIVEFPVSLGP
jgi:hypothetical protein